ncbi:CID domain-containing protein [Aphelenchoides besseyi]|nr:CID domain-containing protein [Aphelenchoides besseyi]
MPISADVVRRRLEKVNSTCPSVQSTSKWILELKNDIDIITRTWFEVYQHASDELRIALIYVMNDAVQTAKLKKDSSVSIAFHPYVVNAIALASDDVKKPINRCLEIFRERHIFPKHVIDEMQAALDGEQSTETAEEFLDDGTVLDPDLFTEKLSSYSSACNAIDKARTILDSINFDVDFDDNQVNSSNGPSKSEKEVDVMIEKLETFISSIKTQCTRTTKMHLLTRKAIFDYSTQLKDVGVVHEAYDRFSKGIEGSLSVLETIVRTSVLPGQSSLDASSSKDRGNSLNESAEDDMEIDEEDKPANSNAKSSFVAPKDYVPSLNYSPTKIYQPSSSVSNNEADPRRARLLASNIPQVPTNIPPGVALPSFLSQPPPSIVYPMFDPTAPPPHIDAALQIQNVTNDMDLRKLDINYHNYNVPLNEVQQPYGSQFYILDLIVMTNTLEKVDFTTTHELENRPTNLIVMMSVGALRNVSVNLEVD